MCGRSWSSCVLWSFLLSVTLVFGRNRSREELVWSCRGMESLLRREMVRVESHMNASVRLCAHDGARAKRLHVQSKLVRLVRAMLDA